MNAAIRIGALISGGGTNLQAIIDACESGTIDGKMVFVGSDNPSAGGLKRARDHGIAHFVVDYRDILRRFRGHPPESRLPEDFNLRDCLCKQHIFPGDTPVDRVSDFLKSRAIAESELLIQMARHEFDLLVLAGFMRKLTPYFIDRVNVPPERLRIMNIHPAILPAFPGTDGYGDTFRYGCKVGGCTVHFVDYGEDSGPIIGQRTFPILPGDTLEGVKKKGLEQEWILYPECVQLVARNKLHLVRKDFPLPDGGIVCRTIVEIDP
ncbi:MAG: phosphoribosylglycinamide formyltransferase [Deltaproteobacteria bacterium]|nr:phosphoribosylglycinamide formyltransferase [Deltaproteobacteria bacterium]